MEKWKEARLNERNRDMFTFLEFMNNAPIFVWNHLSAVSTLHAQGALQQ